MFLKSVFNVDTVELDQILNDFEQRRQSKVKIVDVVLDQSYLDIKSESQQQMIYDFKCSICYGLVRPPQVTCRSCNKIYCQVCIRDVKANYHRGVLEDTLGINNVSMMDMDAFA